MISLIVFFFHNKVRLVAGGHAAYQGRVEIFLGGLWGTVCEDSWDLQDAQVVCRQLGYDGSLAAPKQAAFGRGTAALWMSDVQCAGHESSLSDCWRSRQLYCMDSDDASVVCSPPGDVSDINVFFFMKCSLDYRWRINFKQRNLSLGNH